MPARETIVNSLAERLTGRWETPVAALLALGIALSLVRGLWFFLGGAETDVAVPSAPQASPAARATGLSATEIAALDLFGEPESAAAARAALDAPETRLQLELHGVFLADEDADSSAIVAERNRDGTLYRVGDRLPGNAELVRVLGDRIVLRRAGRLETLRFPDAGEGAGFVRAGSADDRPLAAAGAPRSALRGAGARNGLAPAPLGPPSGPGAERANSASGGADSLRDRLEQVRERLRVDPEGTLSSLGVEPVGDGAGGYRLGGEVDAATLSRVGLRRGDVVLSVNGETVGNIQQDQARLESIMEAGSARLEIQRGDRRFFVTTRIR
jgi:general secretion pathway protein C